MLLLDLAYDRAGHSFRSPPSFTNDARECPDGPFDGFPARETWHLDLPWIQAHVLATKSESPFASLLTV